MLMIVPDKRMSDSSWRGVADTVYTRKHNSRAQISKHFMPIKAEVPTLPHLAAHADTAHLNICLRQGLHSHSTDIDCSKT